MTRQLSLLKSILVDFQVEWQLPIMLADFEWLEKRATDEFLEGDLPRQDDWLLSVLSEDPKEDPFPDFLPNLKALVARDGSLLESPSSEAIYAIRQISRTFKKIFEVCSDDKVDDAIANFIAVDESLSGTFDDLTARVCSVLHGRELFKMSAMDTFSFRHGPGAVAEKLDSVSRWDFPSVSQRIADRFDMSDFYPTYHEDWPCDIFDAPSRLVAVPKTFLTPRLICIEPASSMYVQQGLLASLDRWMSKNPQTNMRDQTINNDLARIGSLDGHLATIDLSEASDRVSLALVEHTFSLSPSFLRLLLDTRTRAVATHDRCILLKKFAPMGCATTFPIQMLVFRSIVIGAIVAAQGDSSSANIKRWGNSPQLGFYGDDIVIPSEYMEPVSRALETHGLKVNRLKSFSRGLFRESCGKDYYAGYPVNPVYMRRNPPRNKRDVQSIASMVASANLFWDRCLPRTAKLLTRWVESLIGPLGSDHDGLSSECGSSLKTRYNRDLQRVEYYAPFLVPVRERAKGTDSAILSKALSSINGGKIVNDRQALSHHARPTTANIRRGWKPASNRQV